MIMDKLMTYHSLDIQWETTMCCGWGRLPDRRDVLQM